MFVRKARFLRYLDVSEMAIGRKEAELLVQALARKEASPRGGEVRELVEVTGAGVPVAGATAKDTGSERSASHPTGLGLDLTVEGGASSSDDEADLLPIFSSAPLLSDSASADSAPGGVLSIRFENCNLKGQALEALAHGVRASALKHISLRRNKINAMGAVALAVMIKDYAVAPDGAGARESPRAEEGNPFGAGAVGAGVGAVNGGGLEGGEEARARVAAEREQWQNSEVRAKLRRQIEELPRTGSLLTLDVKGNEIRVSTVYAPVDRFKNRRC